MKEPPPHAGPAPRVRAALGPDGQPPFKSPPAAPPTASAPAKAPPGSVPAPAWLETHASVDGRFYGHWFPARVLSWWPDTQGDRGYYVAVHWDGEDTRSDLALQDVRPRAVGAPPPAARPSACPAAPVPPVALGPPWVLAPPRPGAPAATGAAIPPMPSRPPPAGPSPPPAAAAADGLLPLLPWSYSRFPSMWGMIPVNLRE